MKKFIITLAAAFLTGMKTVVEIPIPRSKGTTSVSSDSGFANAAAPVRKAAARVMINFFMIPTYILL